MPQRQILAELITRTREEKGLSLSQAANLIAVSPSTLRDWENGKRLPRPNKLQMLAGVLGVPLLQLIDGRAGHHDPALDSDKLAQLEQRVRLLADKQRELQATASTIASEIAELRKTAQAQNKLAS